MENETESQSNSAGLRAVPAPSAYAALPAGQMVRARAIQETCLQTMARELSSHLDTVITATLAGIDSLPDGWGDSQDGACRLTLEISPVRGQAFVIMAPELASQLLQLLLGAPNREGVPVTDLELHVLRETFEIVVRALNMAWGSPHVHMQWTATNAVLPEPSPLLVFDCRLAFGGVESGFRFAMPALAARLAAMQSGDAGVEENPAAVRSSLLAALRNARVEAQAVLAGPSLLMSDLLSLEPGQVLVLGEAAGSPLECRINGKTKFRGDWIVQGDKVALQIQ
jgi:flagellar motor switch protein FliM